MNTISFLTLAALPAMFVSCASQTGGEDYDVSNPYAAPDYVDEAGSPYEANTETANVNPAYDAPAVYEDAAPSAPDPAATAPSRPATASAKVHTVVRGDSLWGIGKKYGVSIDAIKQANGMTKDTAVLGAKLQIPAR